MEVKVKTSVNSFTVYDFKPGEVFTNGTRYFMKTNDTTGMFNVIDIQSGELLNLGANKGPYQVVKGAFICGGT